MGQKRLSKTLLTLAAWIAIILSLWAAFAIFNTIFLFPGENIWRFKLEMAAGLALLLALLVRTARWCFRKRSNL
jgi:hypothetical protein